jgi:hypothetical protein
MLTLSESPTYTDQEKKKSNRTKNNLPQTQALFNHYQYGAVKAEHKEQKWRTKTTRNKTNKFSWRLRLLLKSAN